MLRKILLLSAFFTLVACGGGTGPLVRSGDTGNTDAQSDTKIRNAIIRAGHQQGWRMKLVKKGEIVATMYKHGFMALTEIKYSPENYTIQLKDTSNKDFSEDWVDDLDDEIKQQLKSS